MNTDGPKTSGIPYRLVSFWACIDPAFYSQSWSSWGENDKGHCCQGSKHPHSKGCDSILYSTRQDAKQWCPYQSVLIRDRKSTSSTMTSLMKKVCKDIQAFNPFQMRANHPVALIRIIYIERTNYWVVTAPSNKLICCWNPIPLWSRTWEAKSWFICTTTLQLSCLFLLVF